MSGLQFSIAFQVLLSLAFQTSILFANGPQLTTKSLPGCPDKTKTWNRTYVSITTLLKHCIVDEMKF